MKDFLITGATGQLGRGIVEQLLKRVQASSIAVLVRDPSAAGSLASLGVEIRKGDYQDCATLESAFEGVEKLMFVSTTAFSDAITQHRNVVDAATHAGVRHVHYTGVQRPEDLKFVMSQVTEWETATEKALAESGMKVTLLRNTLYLDALPLMMGDDALVKGIHAPAGSARAALAARAELAEAAAVMLAGSGHAGRTYTLGGSEAVSMSEIAAIVSSIAGKNLPYENVTPAEFTAVRIAAGLPDFVAAFLSEWFAAVAAGEFSEVTGDLERLLGRKPLTAAQFLPTVLASLVNS
jgi:NAD(P)H dehydrogenase (quinone)